MLIYKKKQLLHIVSTLEKANEVIMQSSREDSANLIDILIQCQELAVELGNQLEMRGEQGQQLVGSLEEYCEILYQQSLVLADSTASKKYSKKIRALLAKIGNEIRFELQEDKREVVFFPYKVSMWDSLESVWEAAKRDDSCDVYVVPIPYFDRRQDGTLGEMHDEGKDYPEYVPVISWQEYDIEERRPDMVFIHNPYDECNLVTSVHPRYYSKNLKQYTDCLVYIPYYVTSGGMSEGQRSCPAYVSSDYIVIQSKMQRKYFEESLPEEKFLPYGSPKVDKIIRKCMNPPEIPSEWREKMAGKKVYFYNTSIGGMLEHTENFLKKMEYVFRTFEGRQDACLLWRPHPLLESTFDSMRPQYKPIFEMLKTFFVQRQLGIYDETPDMTDAIAWSDAYIGDSATSVLSLFGIAGKPIFMFCNRIHEKPSETDWRGEIIVGFNGLEEHDGWLITQGNKLYCAKNQDYHYTYYCDLSEYSFAGEYAAVLSVGEDVYVCPNNALDILKIGETGIEKRISLKQEEKSRFNFSWSYKWDKYLLLIPYDYPAIVRYDTVNDEVSYFSEHLDVFLKEEQGIKKIGGGCIYKDQLVIASPVDNFVYMLQIESGTVRIAEIPTECRCGCFVLDSCGDDLWILPYDGRTILSWNPETGEVRCYEELPEGFACVNPIHNCVCEELPFRSFAFYGDDVYISPHWANMYIKLNKKTGEMKEWIPPFEEKQKGGYYFSDSRSYFFRAKQNTGGKIYRIYSAWNRKLYDIDLETEEYSEVGIEFDVEELRTHEAGFARCAKGLQYGCQENAFCSLEDFLDGTIIGNPFDREKQIEAYENVMANSDGTCGEKVYKFLCDKYSEKQEERL